MLVRVGESLGQATTYRPVVGEMHTEDEGGREGAVAQPARVPRWCGALGGVADAAQQAAQKPGLVTVVAHEVARPAVSACGAAVVVPGHEQVDRVLAWQGDCTRVGPGVAGGRSCVSKPLFGLLLHRQVQASAVDVAEVGLWVVDGVLPLLVVEVAGAAGEAGQRLERAPPHAVTQQSAAACLPGTLPGSPLCCGDPCGQGEMTFTLWRHLGRARRRQGDP